MSVLRRTTAAAAAAIIALTSPLAGGSVSHAAEPATYTVTVHPDEVVQEDFLGVGVNLIPTVLMPNNTAKGYNEALWQIDRERIARLRPAVARVWFQVDWMESEPGVYTWESPKMQAFYTYLDALQRAGTEIELNFGWKNGRAIQEWFSFPGISGRVSAPRDLEAFGRSASAALSQLINERGYDNVKYLSFYNEPAGSYDFETPADISQVVYYEKMARAVHDQLVEDGLREQVQIWGPEEWAAPGWTEYMARVGSDVFDLYTFHVYGGSYSTLSDEIAKRTSQTYGGEVGLTEFGFSGRYDSRWDAGYGNYVIKLANEGVKVGLIWQLNGVWLEDPDESVDTNSTYTLWDSLAVTDTPNHRYYEAGMLMRYVPAHSTVVRTQTSDDGVRAATFRTQDDVTMVVEVDESAGQRTIDIDLGVDPGKPVAVMQYAEPLTPTAEALLPQASRSYTGQRFTDTVGGGRHVLVYTTVDQARQLSVTPDRAEVVGGETVELAATLAGGSGGVEWSVTSGVGTVSADGRYTAPEVAQVETVSVTAAVVGHPESSATAVLTVVPAPEVSRVDLPAFTVAPGDYIAPLEVGIVTPTDGATIHYTLDGSAPTAESPSYTEPLTLSGSAMVRAIAVKEGLTASPERIGYFRVRTLPSGPDGFTHCSNQGQICGFDDLGEAAEVAYGAGGQYAIGLFDTRVTCDTSTFGTDPAPGQTKMCFVRPHQGGLPDKPSFSPAPGEYFTKTLKITLTIPEGSEVYYTASGALPTTSSTRYTGGEIAVPTSRGIKAIAVKDGVQSPIAIGGYTITDPFPGPEGYDFCANQHYQCNFDGPALVAFGSWNNFVYGVFNDGVQCVSSHFDGEDPSPGYSKQCYVKPLEGDIVGKPLFSPAPGTYVGNQSVTITADQGATVHYTTDGSEPSASSPVYSEPIPLPAPSTTTVRAIAVKDGLIDSMIATGRYTLQADPNVGAPEGFVFCAGQHYQCAVTEPSMAAYGADGSFLFQEVSGSFVCNSATFGGADPAPGKIKRCYLGPLEGGPSQRVAAPAFSPAGGAFSSAQQVEISSATDGATIHYTRDGSEPSVESPVYSGPVPVAQSTTIKAIAVKDGLEPSSVTSATFTIESAPAGGPEGYVLCASQHYECVVSEPATVAYGADGSFLFQPMSESFICNSAAFGGVDPAPGKIKRCYLGPLVEPAERAATPVFSPNGGTFTTAQQVTISSATEGATVHFTTDGSQPSVESPAYTEPIMVTATTTLKAIAVKQGLDDSELGTAVFTIDEVQEAEPWRAGQVYLTGDLVGYEGAIWMASWWTRGQQPGEPWGPWQELREQADGTAVWTRSRIFLADEPAVHEGLLYRAKWWTRNQPPGEENGPWQRVD